DEQTDFEMHKPNPRLLEIRKSELKQLRAERDGQAVGAALKELKTAAKGSENLMPHLQDAARCYATMGEIAGVFREVFGEHEPVSMKI
ncbi:MAG: methylmalonyl-CoA mutase, partial [Thermoleophilia bacterium]|nr:methylmalonyl-CoA mutase [Thermoleophilia bacterium]